MPYISSQQQREVSWDEITPENEKNKSCVVEEFFSKRKMLGKGIGYLRQVGKDMKKGIKQGLEHEKLKYEYEI